LNIKSLPDPFWQSVGKFFVFVLIFFGGMFFMWGLHYLIKDPSKNHDSSQKKTVKREKLNANTVMSLIIAVLTLITVILKYF
jgi:uncharacterized membrane protein